MITSPVPDFPPPPRSVWLLFMCVGVVLTLLIVRGLVAICHDLVPAPSASQTPRFGVLTPDTPPLALKTGLKPFKESLLVAGGWAGFARSGQPGKFSQGGEA